LADKSETGDPENDAAHSGLVNTSQWWLQASRKNISRLFADLQLALGDARTQSPTPIGHPLTCTSEIMDEDW
jgi:hypothetical protein